jgi:hypothetical protein
MARFSEANHRAKGTPAVFVGKFIRAVLAL